MQQASLPHSLSAAAGGSADAGLRALAESQAQALLATLGRESAVLDEIKRVVARRIANGPPTLDAVAVVIGLNARTLQRRLAEEGLSFRDVVEAVRKAQAERLLRCAELSLNQIAFLLGYAEQSSFHSAFRRWTGQSPGAWRRTLATA
ncbi:helix-turn-helix transcriptional regulator [Sinimarinibacterium thermocellulolyticum]|uniref:Helix-turn-helix transcriptional regulator n=1 Tax=Sinimarinibacterium thermocellulolyticum TaxID=3170016 RepID=A0ABV2AEY1_9GAMM